MSTDRSGGMQKPEESAWGLAGASGGQGSDGSGHGSAGTGGGRSLCHAQSQLCAEQDVGGCRLSQGVGASNPWGGCGPDWARPNMSPACSRPASGRGWPGLAPLPAREPAVGENALLRCQRRMLPLLLCAPRSGSASFIRPEPITFSQVVNRHPMNWVSARASKSRGLRRTLLSQRNISAVGCRCRDDDSGFRTVAAV